MRPHRVGIVGGGVLGTVLAYRLAQSGANVTLLERGPRVGGLAASMDFGGHIVDRFYHVIVPSDDRMLAMADELGLGDALEFSPTGVGFYIDGGLHPLNGIGDFLRFSPLTVSQRARLAWFIAQCQLRRGYGKLDSIPLETWLRRHCGSAVTERIWKPLLESRFESRPDGLPATYIWARTRRMSSARQGAGRGEVMGHVVGGHQRLLDAIADAAIAHGATFETNAPVEALAIGGDGGVDGVTVGGEMRRFDQTIVTLQPPALRFLLPENMQGLLASYPQRYLGVVCLVLKLRRSISPFYSVNICDPTPITTVVETSHVVGTNHTDGLRLVYVPRYCDTDSPEHADSDRAIFERYTTYVANMLPAFSETDVVDWTVQRAKLVEPVHELGAGSKLAPVWPHVPRLALASNAQIYPWLLNGNSVMAFAEEVAREGAARLGLGVDRLSNASHTSSAASRGDPQHASEVV
jgi:protoporphyrinogen oxidase